MAALAWGKQIHAVVLFSLYCIFLSTYKPPGVYIELLEIHRFCLVTIELLIFQVDVVIYLRDLLKLVEVEELNRSNWGGGGGSCLRREESG